MALDALTGLTGWLQISGFWCQGNIQETVGGVLFADNDDLSFLVNLYIVLGEESGTVVGRHIVDQLK